MVINVITAITLHIRGMKMQCGADTIGGIVLFSNARLRTAISALLAKFVQEWTVNNMRLIDVTKFFEENPNLPYAVLVALLKSPTIDAVPVVRCKDCKEYKNGECEHPVAYGMGSVLRPEPNDFCSYGERKE